MASPEDFLLSSTETTFQYGEDLPSLPVPDLSYTLKKYLDSVRPLVSEEEYRKTEFLAQQFATGEGKYLQERLQEKAKGKRNWLEKWWEDVAYLETRMPAPLINMGGIGPYCEDIWPAKPGSQMERMGLMMHFTLKFWEYVHKEKIRPLKNNNGKPICMYQYRRIFSTCKVPGIKRDKLMEYFRTETEGGSPMHIVVLCKGNIFVMNPFDASGEVLSAPMLQNQLEKIKKRSDELGQGQGVNYFTTLPRTQWAQLRNRLIAIHPSNFELLEIIQKSILLVGIEDEDVGDLSNQALQSLLGNVENRWLDKSMSTCTYKNGLVVTNADHTPAEGLMMVIVTSYIHAKVKECNGQWQGSMEIRPQKDAVHMTFVIDDDIRRHVEAAKQSYKLLQQAADAYILIYDKYGKNFCKSKRIHPDAVCQLAMQLTYYRIYGRMAPTYETAPIKQFYHGRTETLRACTDEAAAFCKGIVNPSLTTTDQYKLLVTAAEKHNKIMVEACDLKACDRHFVGLGMIAREEGRLPHALFLDPSFIKSGGGGNFLLSTSCIGYSSVLGGVLPMCENSLGVFYRINEDKFSFYITTWNADVATSSPGFAKMLVESLDMIKNVVDAKSGAVSARL